MLDNFKDIEMNMTVCFFYYIINQKQNLSKSISECWIILRFWYEYDRFLLYYRPKKWIILWDMPPPPPRETRRHLYQTGA